MVEAECIQVLYIEITMVEAEVMVKLFPAFISQYIILKLLWSKPKFTNNNSFDKSKVEVEAII